MDGVVTVARSHRFIVAEYHRMAEVGILDEDSRVELIRGQIVNKAPIGAPHLGMVNRLTRLLLGVLAGRGILSVQNPVRLDDGSEPEPDVVVLPPRADDYATAPASVLWTQQGPSGWIQRRSACRPQAEVLAGLREHRNSLKRRPMDPAGYVAYISTPDLGLTRFCHRLLAHLGSI